MEICYRSRRVIIKGKQKCFRCGEIKLIKEFWVDKNRYLGIRGTCKSCMKKERNKLYAIQRQEVTEGKNGK